MRQLTKEDVTITITPQEEDTDWRNEGYDPGAVSAIEEMIEAQARAGRLSREARR